ncbi:MAG: mechanosensitive ion channel [Chloroflexota bacterium]|nr:mechanosensitive ion channel [Chloroflexota bacterium]
MDQLVDRIGTYLPRGVGAVGILVVGVVLAVVGRRLVVFVLRRLGFDALGNRLGLTAVLREATIERSPSEFLGTVILWAILIFAVVTAIGSLGLEFLAGILSQIVFYGLRALLGIVVLILGTATAGLLASLSERGLTAAGVSRMGGITSFVRYSVIFISVILAAAILGVDVTILIVVTVIVLGAIALTAALAIGLGLRSLSSNVAASRYVSEGISEGDRISLNGVSGTVERVGHAVTTVRSVDGRTYLIPNAHFLEHVVEKQE